MGAYIMLAVIGIPCTLFLLYCLTPRGKHWLRVNGMLWYAHRGQSGQSPLRGRKWKPPTFTCRRLLKITQRSWHCVYLLWDSGLGVTVTVVTVNFGIILGLWLMCSSWRNWKNDNYDKWQFQFLRLGFNWPTRNPTIQVEHYITL